jgi:SHS2 domain-containing protein
MKPQLSLPLLALGLSVAIAVQADVLSDAARLEAEGQFNQAAASLTNALNDNSVREATRKQIEWEADRLERIRKDYRLTKKALFNDVKASVKDFSEEEFEK